MSLEEVFGDEAGKAGIPLFGISDLSSPPDYDDYLQWITAGRHADMHYLARQDALLKRKKPDELLPGAKTMLVFGFPYNLDFQLVNDPQQGQIASYARFIDYHETIPVFLSKLILHIQDVPRLNFHWKIFTDSAPIMERSFAQKAGLGWIGKNTNLIAKKLGSFFFIAEILTDLELMPSESFGHDFCGQCRRCIDACPTHCISAQDRTIDSGKCISYLTIENRADIPRDLRTSLGNWIFGCDICQQVCPWNKQNLTQRTPGLELNTETIAIDLHEELKRNETEFKHKYHNSPILRARHAGFHRNLLCVLGNTKDPIHIPELQRVLENEENPMLRKYAAWALGQIDHQKARQTLQKFLHTETEAEVKSEIIYMLDAA